MYASQSSSVTYLPDVLTYAAFEKVYREFGEPDDAWVVFEVRRMRAHAMNETAVALPDERRHERRTALRKCPSDQSDAIECSESFPKAHTKTETAVAVPGEGRSELHVALDKYASDKNDPIECSQFVGKGTGTSRRIGKSAGDQQAVAKRRKR
jgi:hypothetical protein